MHIGPLRLAWLNREAKERFGKPLRDLTDEECEELDAQLDAEDREVYRL